MTLRKSVLIPMQQQVVVIFNHPENGSEVHHEGSEENETGLPAVGPHLSLQDMSEGDFSQGTLLDKADLGRHVQLAEADETHDVEHGESGEENKGSQMDVAERIVLVI